MLFELVSCLKERRKEQNLTLAELAWKSKVNPKLIANIEKGKAIPSIMTVEKLARALGFEIAAQVNICECLDGSKDIAEDKAIRVQTYI